MCKSNKEIWGFSLKVIFKFLQGLGLILPLLYIAINIGYFKATMENTSALAQENKTKIELIYKSNAEEIKPTIVLLKKIEKDVEGNSKSIKKIVPLVYEVKSKLDGIKTKTVVENTSLFGLSLNSKE